MTKLTKWKKIFGKSEKNDLQKRVGKTVKNDLYNKIERYGKIDEAEEKYGKR